MLPVDKAALCGALRRISFHVAHRQVEWSDVSCCCCLTCVCRATMTPATSATTTMSRFMLSAKADAWSACVHECDLGTQKVAQFCSCCGPLRSSVRVSVCLSVSETQKHCRMHFVVFSFFFAFFFSFGRAQVTSIEFSREAPLQVQQQRPPSPPPPPPHQTVPR